MSTTIRLFLLIVGASFLLASLIHRGMFITGYAQRAASTAETVIAVVVLMALGLAWLWLTQTRLIGLIAQAFALLGTLVGALTIAIGIGPRTIPDVVYHISILAVLAWGLVVIVRMPAEHATGDLSGCATP